MLKLMTLWTPSETPGVPEINNCSIELLLPGRRNLGLRLRVGGIGRLWRHRTDKLRWADLRGPVRWRSTAAKLAERPAVDGRFGAWLLLLAHRPLVRNKFGG